MNKYISTITLSLLFLGQNVFGQKIQDSLYHAGICDESGYCIPQIPGLGRAKGLEIKYRRVLNYKIETEIGDSTFSDYVDINRKFSMKIRLSVILKNNFKMVTGVSYETEEFNFKNKSNLSNEFYKALDDKNLRSLGVSTYMIKPFMGNKYLLSRANFRLSGDFSRNSLVDYFRASVSVLYGKRSSSDLSWGVGLSYNYSFGRQLVIPVIAYTRKFSNKLSVSAFLPVKISFKYIASDKNIFEFVNKVGGEKYNIQLNSFNNDNLFLERSYFLSMMVYEREIYDFLWMSVSAGGRFNISFDLSENNAFLQKSSPQITNSLSDAMFYELSLFIVPPKKWNNK